MADDSSAAPSEFAAVVRRAWAHSLNGGPFATDDDFFACGGDSLAALAAASEVATATGLDVPALWLYENPRLEDAVRALTAAAEGGLAPIEPQERAGAHPLSFQQEGLLRVMDHIRAGHRYHVAYAIELPDSVDEGRLAAAVTRLASRHPALTTRITGAGELARQEVAGAAELELKPLRVMCPDDAVAATKLWAAASVINLDGPLARFALIGSGSQRVLALVAHQMVMDPWSWGLLLRDLAVLHDDPDAGGGPALAYSDYARWQRQHLSGAAYEHHLGHWRRTAEGYPSGGVPLPGPRGDIPAAGPAARLPLAVPAEHAQALHTAGQMMGASLFEVLLSLFHVAVGRWAGTSDVLVASATASRTRPGSENIAGFFVNGRFTRTALTELRTFGDLIGHVRDRWRAGDPHRELHLEKVLFDLGRPDMANIKFSVNAIPTLTGLTLTGEPLRLVSVPGARSARRHISVGLAPDAGGGLSGALTYRTDLLVPAQVRALAQEFLTLCSSAAHAPATALITR
ncbi:condensation domain-containing protein [Streptomyces sp. NBC_01142]|uniref:condensation domain-containing protein n=1 Tax=Streptomyces sp. NBC_01142 TaxID=2975865 RepID=UPI002254255D|nr:condensation domain-containing protein [Streptomyces sp. NBC_01142]MCX4827073.1 condensation domain-containing protein [Streptomyces sp. NBC_01142]